MRGFIYAADIWCSDCGESIRDRIRAEGNAPADEDDQASYDSGEYPKDCDVSGESDSPQHCGAGAECINAVELSDGWKIGAWLENDLTTDGADYVKEAVREGGEVADLWREWYNWIDFDDRVECAGCNEKFDADDLNEEGFCIDCEGEEGGPDCPDYPEACPGVHDCPDYPDCEG